MKAAQLHFLTPGRDRPDFSFFLSFVAVSGLSCSVRDLSLQCTGFSLVVACGFFPLQLWRARSRVRGLCSLLHAGSS